MKTTLHITSIIKATAQQFDDFWTITITVTSKGSCDSEVEFFFQVEEAFNEAKKAFYNIQTEDCRS